MPLTVSELKSERKREGEKLRERVEPSIGVGECRVIHVMPCHYCQMIC